MSPRWRAGRTADLFFGEENLFEVRKEGDGKDGEDMDGEDMDGDGKDGDGEKEVGKEGVKKEVTDELAEWDYGDYEGLLTREIRERRKMEGRDGVREWDIWRDRCVGGEYVC